jgi:hypothetical protein
LAVYRRNGSRPLAGRPRDVSNFFTGTQFVVTSCLLNELHLDQRCPSSNLQTAARDQLRSFSNTPVRPLNISRTPLDGPQKTFQKDTPFRTPRFENRDITRPPGSNRFRPVCGFLSWFAPRTLRLQENLTLTSVRQDRGAVHDYFTVSPKWPFFNARITHFSRPLVAALHRQPRFAQRGPQLPHRTPKKTPPGAAISSSALPASPAPWPTPRLQESASTPGRCRPGHTRRTTRQSSCPG